MDEADRGAGLDDLFVLDHQVEMNRLRQHRMLRAEGDDGAGHGRKGYRVRLVEGLRMRVADGC